VRYHHRQVRFDGFVIPLPGYIDKTGTMIIKPRFDQAGDFGSGLAAVQVNGKYGYMDKQRKDVIKLQYNRAKGFSERPALVQVDSKIA
jgi:hypothetical protein